MGFYSSHIHTEFSPTLNGSVEKPLQLASFLASLAQLDLLRISSCRLLIVMRHRGDKGTIQDSGIENDHVAKYV